MRKYWSKEGPQHSKENTNSSEQCISTNSSSTVSLISKSLNRHTPLALLVVIHFNISWTLFTTSVPLSLADNSRNWVLQNLGVPNEIQTSASQFHTMTYKCLHWGSPSHISRFSSFLYLWRKTTGSLLLYPSFF